ncbi:MAG: hypothetical protein AVDCRST_MAG13-4003, partial [uncultured Solirubrobacteraceae bacterium]
AARRSHHPPRPPAVRPGPGGDGRDGHLGPRARRAVVRGGGPGDRRRRHLAARGL